MKKHEVTLDFETSKLSKDQIALFLMKEVVAKRKLLYKERKKFITNAYFSSIYTIECLSGIMNETISKVVNAHEAFVCRRQEIYELNKLTKSKIIAQIIKSKKDIVEKAFEVTSDIDEDNENDEQEDNIISLDSKRNKVKKTDILKLLENLLKKSEYQEEVTLDSVEEYQKNILKSLNKTNLNKLKKEDLIDIVIQFHIPNYSPNISKNLDLSTLGNITGYFINAFSNNISKDYKKYTATKREGELVSYDVSSDTDNDEQKDTIMVFNQMHENNIEELVDKEEFKNCFRKVFFALKKYDKKVNNFNKNKYPNGDIPLNKRSFLSYLFIYLIDPKLKGKYVYIKEKLDISQYIFNAKKEEIVEFIKRNYPEEAKFMYKYITSNYETYGENLRPKKTENYYDQSCTVKDSFEIKFINKRLIEVIYKVEMMRLNNGRWEVLDSKSFSKRTIKDKMNDTKEMLKIENSNIFSILEEEANTRRINANKEIYVA